MPERIPPIEVDAASPPQDPKNGAAIIFIHGLADDGKSWEFMPSQFKSAGKLPHLTWVLPNALENRDTMSTAWYVQSKLTSVPPSRPELAEDEDEDGLVQSRGYIEGLVRDLEERKGIPPERVVVAGFSQGCALCLLLGLTSPTYAGSKIAGIAGLCGYMPIEERMEALRKEADLPEKVGDLKVFLARGKRDSLVPSRFYNQAVKRLEELGVNMDGFEGHEVENMAHTVNGEVLRDLCTWLEKVVPAKE